ncbi:MAG: ChaN family lipoprotein, partial [Bacteroidota bacterium]
MKYLAKLFMLLMSLSVFTSAQDFDSEKIPIGDEARKYDFCTVKLDKILDTKSNAEKSFKDVISELGNLRIVMIGETHTNQLHHDVQFDVIKGLTESGKKVILALEMYNPNQNEALAKWSSGETDASTFMEQTDYLVTWSHNYRYYKAIFDYAREKHIPIHGVNVERKYASKIGKGGLASLTPEEAEAIPVVDTANIEHRFLIKVMMQGMDASMPAQFKNMYAAQSLWDTAMGEGAIKAAEENPDAVVVVLAGSGHVMYNLGIGRIIQDRSDLSFASVITVDIPESTEEFGMMKVKKAMKKEASKKDSAKSGMPVMKESKSDEHKAPAHGGPHSMMGMDSTPSKIVVKSLGDYLWGKKEMEQEKYPAFGFSINDKNDAGFPVKRVMPETIAYENGLRKGDVILSIDGKEFENSFELKKHLQFKNWDEEISFDIVRDEEKS